MKATEIDNQLVPKLERIGEIKQLLPLNQRGWCNELRLFVQLREARGMSRLEAGGKFRARIDLWREAPDQPWQVRKHNPGEWQALVDPTLQLAEWLAERDGMTEEVKEDFDNALHNYSVTGHLDLPQDIRSMGRGELAQSLVGMTDHNVTEFVPRVETYLSNHPQSALAWDCLREMYTRTKRFKAALHAANQALQYASKDGAIHYEVALLYTAAFTNETRARGGLAGCGRMGSDPEQAGSKAVVGRGFALGGEVRGA